MRFCKNKRRNRQYTLGGAKRTGWLWGMLTGLMLLGIGALEGQFSVIYKKAVMICLECIGIG
jgi:hypothetical protein